MINRRDLLIKIGKCADPSKVIADIEKCILEAAEKGRHRPAHRHHLFGHCAVQPASAGGACAFRGAGRRSGHSAQGDWG